MELLPLLCVVSLSVAGLTKGDGVLPDGPLNGKVGGTMAFTTTVTPSETPFFAVNWKLGDKDIISFNARNETGPEYEGRITLFISTGALELRNLTLNDSGEYRLFISPQRGSIIFGSTRLNVHEPVSNAVAAANSIDLVEFDSSVRLSCSSSSGSSLSFLWLNSSSEVTASDGVQLTDGGSTLTIVSVSRYDQGPFRCRVFNPVSNGTSDPVNLSISFGPENVNLTSPSQEYHKEGSSANLSCSAVSEPAAQFNWFLNGGLLPDTGPELRLVNIQMGHSGNFSCQAFNNKTLRYVTSQPSVMIVLESVSNVTVKTNSTDLVEFDSSVRLSCSSSSGSSLSFLWLNSSSEVTASDGVQLTDGGSTLTIVSVSRYDQGPFRCRVFNPVSNGTSDPVNLSISFGPENIALTSPTQYWTKGSNVTLSCSAVSKPSAQFYWFLNGVKLSDIGPELRLINVQLSQSGNYSCQAFNQRTGRYGESQPSPLSVLEVISHASVTSSTSLPIEGNSLNLTCEAAGSVFTRTWMKDDSALILTDNATLHDGNRVLSFNGLNKRHSGEYYCEISNPVSTSGAKYSMVVNYGPENVQITGPREIHLDETLTLICSAESTPSASFTWKLNGKETRGSSEFTKNITNITDGGVFTCQAMNNVTGKVKTAVHGLTVTVISDKTSSCSVGCIAGIVIAVIVLLCALAAGLLIYQRKKAQTGSITGGEGKYNTSYSGSQELNYSVISFFPSKDGGTDRLESQSNSEYAEVKVNDNPPPASSPPTRDAHLQRTRSAAPQPGANGTQLYAQVRKN